MNTRLSVIWFFVAALAFGETRGSAQVELVEAVKAKAVFSGPISLSLVWTNRGADQIDTEINGKVYLAGSKLAMPLPIDLRARLRLFPNQTALMLVSIDVPDLREKNTLRIRWADGSKLIGKTELTVYSRNILRELELMAGEERIGLRCSDEKFKKAFGGSGVRFTDLDDDAIASFQGRLLVLSASADKSMELLARRGATIICIVPTRESEELRPNFYAIPYERGVVVFVQDDFLADFDANPESQLRLIQICRMATMPGRPGLPVISKDLHEN